MHSTKCYISIPHHKRSERGVQGLDDTIGKKSEAQDVVHSMSDYFSELLATIRGQKTAEVICAKNRFHVRIRSSEAQNAM